MKIRDAISIAKKFLLLKKGRFFFTSFAIGIGTCVLFLFSTFSNGLKETILPPLLEKSSPTTLVVRPDYKSLVLFSDGKKLTPENIKKISSLPHVTSIGRQLLLKFPNSIRISLFGLGFETDVPIFGIDSNIISQTLEKPSKKEEIPIIISPRLIDIFNSSFIDSLPGTQKLTKENIIGREVQILFGQSSFFGVHLTKNKPIEATGVVRGISAKVPTIGITIPLKKALSINKDIADVDPKDTFFQQVFVEVESIDFVSTVSTKIKEMGFLAESYEELGGEIKNLLLIVRIILLFSGFIIFSIALFSLFSLISLSVLEQQRNIGILRVIGARKKDILLLFILESCIISFTGIIIGVFIFGILAFFINQKLLSFLPDISFLPQSFFPISLPEITTLLGVIFLLTIFSTIPPILSTLKKEPLKALWN